MSLFIANLAFADEQLLNVSKTAVLAASLIAGCIDFLFTLHCNSLSCHKLREVIRRLFPFNHVEDNIKGDNIMFKKKFIAYFIVLYYPCLL